MAARKCLTSLSYRVATRRQSFKCETARSITSRPLQKTLSNVGIFLPVGLGMMTGVLPRVVRNSRNLSPS